jgi:hypothetical protein
VANVCICVDESWGSIVRHSGQLRQMAHRAINLVDKRLAPEGFDILFFRHGVVRMAWVTTNAVSRPVVKPMASLVTEWPTCDSATIIFFQGPSTSHKTKWILDFAEGVHTCLAMNGTAVRRRSAVRRRPGLYPIHRMLLHRLRLLREGL